MGQNAGCRRQSSNMQCALARDARCPKFALAEAQRLGQMSKVRATEADVASFAFEMTPSNFKSTESLKLFSRDTMIVGLLFFAVGLIFQHKCFC